MTAALLALCASLSWGVADFGAGVAARRVAVPLVVVGSQTAGLVFVGLVVLGTWQPAPSLEQFLWGLLAGGTGVAALAAFYTGLKVGAMGIVGPISATAAVVPFAYGLARGERPSTLQLAGVGLALVGVVAASVESHPERLARVGAGVGYALLAALGFGISLIGLSKAAAGGWAWAPLSMRCCSVTVILLVLLAVRPTLAGFRRNLPLIAGAGVADTSANMLFGLASTRGLLSVVSVLASLYPVVLVALARFLLHERITRHQLAGVGIALSGVALITAA